MIRIERVYEKSINQKGSRFLVDRIWPRGIKKENLKFEAWLKEAAPSQPLRQWFRHDSKKWKVFRERYFAELDKKPEAWQPLIEAARKGDLILLYGAKEEKFNHAAALKEYLAAKRSSIKI